MLGKGGRPSGIAHTRWALRDQREWWNCLARKSAAGTIFGTFVQRQKGNEQGYTRMLGCNGWEPKGPRCLFKHTTMI